MPDSEPRRPRGTNLSDALSRLYILWLLTTFALAVAIVALTAVNNARWREMRGYLDRIEQLGHALEQRLDQLEPAVRRASAVSAKTADTHASRPRPKSASRPTTRPAPRPPAASPPPASNRIDAALDVAYQRASAGDLIGASQALLNVPDNPSSLTTTQRVRLGMVLLRLERWKALKNVLDTLGEPPPELADQVNFLRAAADVHAGELARALATLDALLLEKPTDYDLLLWRAIVLIAGGKPTQAQHPLATARSVAPQRPEAPYWQAVAEWRAGDTDAAAARLDEVLRSHPGYGPALLTRGRLALEHGDLAQAEESLKAAIGAMPWNGEGHLWLAAVYARLGQFAEARTSLHQALQLDPHLARLAAQDTALAELLNETETNVP